MNLPSYRTLVRFSEEKMVKVNLFESHRMFADLYCLLPGQEQKPHTHEGNDKFYFVLEGRGRFLVGTEWAELGQGQMCVAPSGEPHGVRNDSDEPLVLLVSMAPHPRLMP
jgi:mannose-6-phosphate isomerase-like protein (cupin superfamily)